MRPSRSCLRRRRTLFAAAGWGLLLVAAPAVADPVTATDAADVRAAKND